MRHRSGLVLDRVATFGISRLERIRDFSRAWVGLRGPLGTREEYLRLWREAQAQACPAVDAYEAECGAGIDLDWLHRLALPTQISVKRSANCYQHGRVLYAALRRYVLLRRAEYLTVVETGTARGFSTLCLAKALSDTGIGGKILTFDVLPHEEKRYWNSVEDVIGPCTRRELLADWEELVERFVVFYQGDSRLGLHRVACPRIHIAFLDSDHTYAHLKAEFAAIRDRQRAGDLLVFDDYTPHAYPGVVAAADEICRLHRYTPRVITASPERGYLVAEKQ